LTAYRPLQDFLQEEKKIRTIFISILKLGYRGCL
jgi:hypothetical protein